MKTGYTNRIMHDLIMSGAQDYAPQPNQKVAGRLSFILNISLGHATFVWTVSLEDFFNLFWNQSRTSLHLAEMRLFFSVPRLVEKTRT